MQQPSNNILVSIITPCFNSAKTIDKAIRSILNQSHRYVEYIIIDGGSTDNTLELISGYKEDFHLKGYTYKFVSEKDNGMYDAINKGIRFVSGKLVGILNSDDFYEPDCIKDVVDEYVISPYKVLLGKMRICNNGKLSVKKPKNPFYFTTLGWTHPSMFVDSEVYQSVKYKCESIYDDLDFILKVRKEFPITLLNKILTNYVIGGMSTKKPFSSVLKDIKIRQKIYLSNGYSWIHIIDNTLIEVMKFILVKFRRQ